MNEQLINEQYQYILRLIGQKRPEGSINSIGIIPMEVPRMVAPYPSGTNTDFVQLHVAIHAPGRRRPGT